MKKYDLYGGLFWLLIGLFVSGMGIKFSLGTFSYPGPGFFPFLVGLILSCLSLGILILALKERSQECTFYRMARFRQESLLYLGRFSSLILFLWNIWAISLAPFLLMLYLFKVPGAQKWWFSTLGYGGDHCSDVLFFWSLAAGPIPQRGIEYRIRTI